LLLCLSYTIRVNCDTAELQSGVPRDNVLAASKTDSLVADNDGKQEATSAKKSRQNRTQILELAEEWYQQGEAMANKAGNNQELQAAFSLFMKAAEVGHSQAQEEVGLRLLSGLGVKVDVARAVLYLYFAANANQTLAQLALGYLHMNGIGVPKSCQAAVLYYSAPAEQVVQRARQPGPFPVIERARLGADHDARYNPGKEQEMVQYFQYSADMGNADAQTAIGQLFNAGSRGMDQDFKQALHYFTQAAASGDVDATAHLGHLYANGLGVEPNNETALEFFRKGAEKSHAHALYGLGYMYLAGAGVEKNVKKAMQYFAQAADRGSSDSHFHLAVMYVSGVMGKPDYARAFQHFSSASHAGHLVAIYNLALMHLTGLGIPVSCSNALSLLKSVAERGRWARVLHTAHDAYLQSDMESALKNYLRAAEIGLEVGQSNAAYLLERREGLPDTVQRSLASAMHYHRRAADQGNVNSLLRIGDAHYYGRGTMQDLNKSVAIYRQATQLRSAQAMFNLGLMHEHGWGLAKDLHLAKRFYDMAHTTHPDALVPVTLAKWKLQVHMWYDANKEMINEFIVRVSANAENIALGSLCGLLGVLLARRRRRAFEGLATDPVPVQVPVADHRHVE